MRPGERYCPVCRYWDGHEQDCPERQHERAGLPKPFKPTVPSGPVRSVARVVLTRVIVTEGEGIEGDPVRRVSYWYDDDGMLIVRRDTWEESQGA